MIAFYCPDATAYAIFPYAASMTKRNGDYVKEQNDTA